MCDVFEGSWNGAQNLESVWGGLNRCHAQANFLWRVRRFYCFLKRRGSGMRMIRSFRNYSDDYPMHEDHAGSSQSLTSIDNPTGVQSLPVDCLLIPEAEALWFQWKLSYGISHFEDRYSISITMGMLLYVTLMYVIWELLSCKAIHSGRFPVHNFHVSVKSLNMNQGIQGCSFGTYITYLVSRNFAM